MAYLCCEYTCYFAGALNLFCCKKTKSNSIYRIRFCFCLFIFLTDLFVPASPNCPASRLSRQLEYWFLNDKRADHQVHASHLITRYTMLAAFSLSLSSALNYRFGHTKHSTKPHPSHSNFLVFKFHLLMLFFLLHTTHV